MALAIADLNTYSLDSAVNSHAVNLPPNIVAGDLLLMFFVINGGPTVTPASGWTELATSNNGDTFKIYARIADGSEGATATFTNTGNQRATAVTYRITGARTVSPPTSSEIAVSSAVQASTATPDPPSLTPSWGSAENLWIAVTFSTDGGFTFNSYPTDYTLGQQNVQTDGGSGNAVSVAARLLTATSEDPGTFGTTTSRNRTTHTVAVRPAVAAGSLAWNPNPMLPLLVR
jgi:hypothetical protein